MLESAVLSVPELVRWLVQSSVEKLAALWVFWSVAALAAASPLEQVLVVESEVLFVLVLEEVSAAWLVEHAEEQLVMVLASSLASFSGVVLGASGDFELGIRLDDR